MNILLLMRTFYKCENSNEKFMKIILSFNDSQFSLIGEQITDIEIDERNKFEIVNLKNNLLTTFNFFSLNLITLTELNISNNPSLEFDIKVFKSFYKLKILIINDTKVYGSLKHLRNLNNLWELSIHNTDVSPYFEFLQDDTLINIPKNDELREGFFINDVIKKLRDLTFTYSCCSIYNSRHIHEITLFSKTINRDKKINDGSIIYTWYWKANNYDLLQNSKHLINHDENWNVRHLNKMRDNLDINLNLLVEKNKNILLSEKFLFLDKLSNINRLFFQIFNDNGPFSLWLYDVIIWEKIKKFKPFLDYQQFYYQSLVNMNKNIMMCFFNGEQNLRNFISDKNLNFNENLLIIGKSILDRGREFPWKFLIYDKHNDIFEDFNVLKINEFNDTKLYKKIEESYENTNYW